MRAKVGIDIKKVLWWSKTKNKNEKMSTVALELLKCNSEDVLPARNENVTTN